MATQDGKADQELACAQVFVDWRNSVDGVAYQLERADVALGGRWDFVAREQGGQRWLGIEIKGLVLADNRRQFNGWESFLAQVSKQVPGRVAGGYFLWATLPWQFRQQQAKDLVEPFIQALAELDIAEGEQGNLGPGIAKRFPAWPKKPPTGDEALWRERGEWKVIHPPEDLFVLKGSDEETGVEVGMSMGQAFDVDWTLIETLLDIFEPDKQGDVKPNIQLAEAKSKGAVATALLLDSHMPWKPPVIKKALGHVPASAFSAIDGVYLVSTHNQKVERVRP